MYALVLAKQVSYIIVGLLLEWMAAGKKDQSVGNCLQVLDWMGITHCSLWLMQWLKERIKVLRNGSLSYQKKTLVS